MEMSYSFVILIVVSYIMEDKKSFLFKYLNKNITMQFKLTAFYAFGFLEIFEVNDPQKVSYSR